MWGACGFLTWARTEYSRHRGQRANRLFSVSHANCCSHTWHRTLCIKTNQQKKNQVNTLLRHVIKCGIPLSPVVSHHEVDAGKHLAAKVLLHWRIDLFASELLRIRHIDKLRWQKGWRWVLRRVRLWLLREDVFRVGC